MRAILLGCGVAAIVIVAAMAAVMVMGIYHSGASSNRKTSQKEAPKPEHSEVAARVFCQYVVKNSLRSPATAKFAGYRETAAQHRGGGEYEVISHVDSQNGFGALIRTKYYCHVQFDGKGSWDLIDLNFY